PMTMIQCQILKPPIASSSGRRLPRREFRRLARTYAPQAIKTSLQKQAKTRLSGDETPHVQWGKG
ncbi:MAG: hypothetical protein ACXWKC_20915, partial [Xanthobacteraceae bacterium]